MISPAYSEEPTSLHLLNPPPAEKTITSSDLPDSTQVRLRADFAPLYSERDRASRGDSEQVSLRTNAFSGSLFSGCGRLKYYISCSNSSMESLYRKKNDDYYLVNRRQEWNLAAGAALRHRNLLFGVGLGRHAPEFMEREHLDDIRESPGNYLRRGPWRYSFDAMIDLAKAAAKLSLFSGPMYSSVTGLVTSDESGLRSFPLSIIRHGADARVDIQFDPFIASIAFGIDYFENADMLTVPNSMPQDVAISKYRVEHHGTVRLPFTDSLRWSLSGSLAGGWIASYNFDRERFTFFKSEKVRLYSSHADLGAKLPGSMIAGISHSSFTGASPTGFLRLSALSEWSVFQPLDYRYADAELTYHETGGFLNRKFVRSRFTFVPQLYVSNITADAGLITTRKEIVVLVPVYVDTIDRKILDTRLVLFEPSLSVLVKIGRIQVTGAVHQMLPVFIPAETTSGQAGPTVQQHTSDNLVTGGTRLFVSAIWRLPTRGK